MAAACRRRLDPASRAPVAVAVSGGADSVASLIGVARWAEAAGRPVLALCVDHRLQSQSAAWTAFVGQTAAALKVDFQALGWEGPKPERGLAAAARLARHRLLANAAREAGASVLVTGHTASDARENASLGQGPLREWSPSPVWPEGRGVFLFRPLLGQSRDGVRRALEEAGTRWIDDPANDDLRHPRVRARREEGPEPPAPDDLEDARALARSATATPAGGLSLSRAALIAADADVARRVLAAALTCASGRERLARRERVAALLQRLREEGELAATLAGARLVADKDRVILARDAGERRGGGDPCRDLAAHESVVWDGRYRIETGEQGGVVTLLRGRAARLAPGQRRALMRVPAPLRPALPVILRGADASCPILAQSTEGVEAHSLVSARFLAACGAITQEIDLAQGAHGASRAGVLCRSPVT